MRIHNIGSDTLSDSDYNEVKSSGLVEVWYRYEDGGYEGSGNLLGRNAEGKWYLHNLGHCSCNGPMEDFGRSMNDPFDSLEAIEARCSQGYCSEVKDLLEAARAS